MARKPGANQAQINAQTIFPRTSAPSEMARKPFCLGAQPFCRIPAGQVPV